LTVYHAVVEGDLLDNGGNSHVIGVRHIRPSKARTDGRTGRRTWDTKPGVRFVSLSVKSLRVREYRTTCAVGTESWAHRKRLAAIS